MDIERYLHYYETWASNHKSRELAQADLIRAKNEHIVKLYKVQSESSSCLQIVAKAWEQIAECRRVLQWTYAYGYFMPQKDYRKVKFFEYLQGEAESALERLHHCAEKEMEKYLTVDVALEDFKDFLSKLVHLNTATRNFFENLVTALENGLSEVQR